MRWPFSRRPRDQHAYDAWWQQADAAAANPTAEVISHLRASVAPATDEPDEADRQGELLDGLERLRDLHGSPSLPDVPTQHRVIATDQCHFIAPVSLVGPSAVAGKLFLTSARAIFVGATVTAWPWHRVRTVVREDRDIALTILGADLVIVRCNTYGEALEAHYVASALADRSSRGPRP